MPDPGPDTPAPVEPALQQRRRARNIVTLLALVLWVVAIYIAVMVRIDHDIRHV